MIGHEALIRAARRLPQGDPAIREMLLVWLDCTKADEKTASSIDYVDVAIMHSKMKYQLGFLSKDEVIQELRQASEALASDLACTKVLKERLSHLLSSIEDGTLEVIGRS